MRLPGGKAPGPDCVHNDVLKVFMKEDPDALLAFFNLCWGGSAFPVRWKRAGFVLLFKGGTRPPAYPRSYRPISLVNTVAKLYKRLILHRLEVELSENGSLSIRQIGFRRGVGTTDAISRVLELARKNQGREKLTCALISLDVRNALRRKCLSRRIIETMRSYMSQREIQVPRDGGGVSHLSVSAGVPQGSVLGPTLWNILYDGLLCLDLPRGVDTVAYADDLAIVASNRSVPELEAATSAAIDTISTWMRKQGLSLAPQKTEAVMMHKRRYDDFPAIVVDGHAVLPSRGIKYLGVRLDANRNFTDHIGEAAKKAESAALAVARLMPNAGVPSSKKRKMLMSVAVSRLLYAPPVWAGGSPMTARNKNVMDRVNRLAALRVTRAYKTVSGETATFLAGSPPLDLMALERARRWECRREGLTDEELVHRTREIKNRTITLWQERWSSSTRNAAWTKSLLPNVESGWNPEGVGGSPFI